MSDSNQGYEFQSFYENSDRDGSVASSLASHFQGRSTLSREKHTLGKVWILRGKIKIHLLPIDLDDAKFKNAIPAAD